MEHESGIGSSTLQAAVSFIQQRGQAPVASEVVTALLAAEKASKRHKQRYAYASFIGTWRLGFVSGTKKTKTKGGQSIKTVGNGRFLPKFVAIAITYQETQTDGGNVENAVTLGPLNLTLTGPTRFWPKTNSLAFDFTAINANLSKLKLYNSAMRGGAERNEVFQAQSLKDQAFFTFFIVEPDYIAARGKGGGLALWTRQS